jgi:predicted phage tail protein
MWNIIIGIIFVIGGLSGKLVLRGTDSSGALALIGVGLAIWGIVQLTRKKQEQEEA